MRMNSKYVFNGRVKFRERCAADGWRTSRGALANADSWRQVHSLLLLGHTIFTKVKGHASALDVERGAATAQDREGNRQALASLVRGQCVRRPCGGSL